MALTFPSALFHREASPVTRRLAGFFGSGELGSPAPWITARLGVAVPPDILDPGPVVTDSELVCTCTIAQWWQDHADRFQPTGEDEDSDDEDWPLDDDPTVKHCIPHAPSSYPLHSYPLHSSLAHRLSSIHYLAADLNPRWLLPMERRCVISFCFASSPTEDTCHRYVLTCLKDCEPWIKAIYETSVYELDGVGGHVNSCGAVVVFEVDVRVEGIPCLVNIGSMGRFRVLYAPIPTSSSIPSVLHTALDDELDDAVTAFGRILTLGFPARRPAFSARGAALFSASSASTPSASTSPSGLSVSTALPTPMAQPVPLSFSPSSFKSLDLESTSAASTAHVEDLLSAHLETPAQEDLIAAMLDGQADRSCSIPWLLSSLELDLDWDETSACLPTTRL